MPVLPDGPSRREFLAAAALAALLPAGCRKRSRGTAVGFSQMDSGGAWRIAETNSMRQAAVEAGDFDLVVTDAQDQTAKQVADVEDLIAQRVKAVFIAPRDYEGLEPVFEEGRRCGVPLFLIDREAEGVAGVDFVSYLGSDFIEQGRRAGAWLARRTGGRARVVELTGTAGSSVARDRAEGFRAGIADHRGVEIIASQTASFSRAAGRGVMENLLQSLGGKVTAVYAHNDEMALGAIQAVRAMSLRPGRDVLVVSIDGQRAALEAILRGELGATVESNPRFGPLAFATLKRYLQGESVPPRILLEDRLFDSRNAREFLSTAY